MNTGQIDAVSVTSAPLIPIDNDSSNNGGGGNTDLEQSYEMSPSELLVNLGAGTFEEFYPSVAISTLMRIIRSR